MITELTSEPEEQTEVESMADKFNEIKKKYMHQKKTYEPMDWWEFCD